VRKERIAALIVWLVVLLTGAQSAFAQQSNEELQSLKKEMQTLKDGQTAIQKDLQEIKTLLKSAPGAPQPFKEFVVDIAQQPTRGKKGLKVALIEFSDYQCPFCARHVRDTGPLLDKEYIETGKVTHVFMDLPLESIHKFAFKAAEAAQCAAEDGKYWEMHDRLFANQNILGPDDLPKHAEALGLDVTKFKQCLDSGKNATGVRSDLSIAATAAFTGTPSFGFGLVDPKDPTKVKVVKTLVGAQPFAAFKTTLDGLLAEAGSK